MIYLDNHATTPLDPRVLEAMMPYFTTKFGNAASVNHSFGAEAADAVDRARGQVASLIHADQKDIVFTSGATESNNLAIKGAVRYRKGGHVVSVVTEHPSVLDTCATMDDVTLLKVGPDGRVNLDDLKEAVPENTVLVSVMHANNEIGVVQPIAEIGKICRERGALFHTDAAQSVGRIPFDVQEMSVDLASISAHKIYGPKGVGALFVRRSRPRAALAPLIDGGGHERGLRPGTLPVPLVVGFGAACEIAEKARDAESRTILALRERLRAGIFGTIPSVRVNGALDARLPGNLNVVFDGVEGQALVEALGIAVSTGSACSTASPEVSHVLRALGMPETDAARSIRFGIGRFTTEEDIEETLSRLQKSVARLREDTQVQVQEEK